jgi:hypothetical protein
MTLRFHWTLWQQQTVSNISQILWKKLLHNYYYKWDTVDETSWELRIILYIYGLGLGYQ